MFICDQPLQPFFLHMRVYLGRSDVGVAEKLLNSSQVGAVRQQMRGKGVAQDVRTYPNGVDPGLRRHAFDDLEQPLSRQMALRAG